MITVIGTGAGKAENLSLAAFEKIKNAQTVFLRTEKMPLAVFLKRNGILYRTFDALYESAQDFDTLNQLICTELRRAEECCYLVHGSALDDTSVALLDPEEIEILPGSSLADCAAAYLKVPAVRADFTCRQILEGTLPSSEENNMIVCIDSRLNAGELKCILSEIYGDDFLIDFYTEDEDGRGCALRFPLFMLDRQKTYDHTTSIFLKKVKLTEVYKYTCRHLLQILEILCGPNGCPWDSVQTHKSLRPYLIEEAYEVADAIDKEDFYSLYDELGDVLFQVAFHAQIGKKCGEFNFNDVTDAICKKMIRRHPEVFIGCQQSPEINNAWEEQKRKEKDLHSFGEVMRDVPKILPALAYAEKIQYKALKAGINDPDAEKTINDITESLSRLEEQNDPERILGEILFKAVILCRKKGVHPELALFQKTQEFIKAFETAEKNTAEKQRPISSDNIYGK